MLIRWGLCLFLVVLLQGALIPVFENPRMALSEHLTAVQSGTALIAFSLVTVSTKWSQKVNRQLSIGLILGFHLIWAGITIAAITGASQILPHAGHGYQSTPFMEMLVAGIMVIGSVLSITTVSLLLLGLLLE